MKTKLKKIDLKTKQLGNSDLFITQSALARGLSVDRLGSLAGVSRMTGNLSLRFIARSSFGVNWIDTAAVYGMGPFGGSRSACAADLARRTPVRFHQVRLRWDEQGYVHRSLNANSIRRECEESLRRLDVDMIDFTKSIGRPTTWKKAGAQWPSFKRKEKSAGSAYQLRCRGIASRAKDRSHHFASTSVFLSPSRS